MYMDDLLYSTDILEQAQLIAKEAIELLASRGFDLVKWCANSHAKSILSELDERKLAPSIRTLNVKTDDQPLPDFKAVGCVWNAKDDILKVRFSIEP